MTPRADLRRKTLSKRERGDFSGAQLPGEEKNKSEERIRRWGT